MRSPETFSPGETSFGFVCSTGLLAATLYLSVIQRKSAEEIRNKFWVMVLVCYGIPLVLTIIPGAMGEYGAAGAWCVSQFVFVTPLMLRP